MKFCDVCHSTYPAEFTTCPKDQSSLRSTTELVEGMVIRGKYAIQGKIGSGGMATVYRARHMVFDEPRAIKVVSSRIMDDENFLKRFRNEAVITRKLQHPNAVRVDDIDAMEDGRPFIVMELVEGRSLKAVIEQEGPLPPPRALEITRQVASALAAAHAIGIVHRDIKPDNIVLVTSSGKDLVKVLDFGIAKLRESSSDPAYTATQTGMLVGTPQYVSPEQASGRRGDEIDGRSDIYSLGIVLYQMLTGRLPFESDTPMGLLLAHMQTPPLSPQVARPDLKIDDTTTQLLLKCLEKDPGKRFQMAQDLVSSIRPAGDGTQTKVMFSEQYASAVAGGTGTSVATQVARPQPQRTASQPAPVSSSGKSWGAVAALLIMVLGGAGYFFLRPKPHSARRTPVEIVRPARAQTPAVQTPSSDDRPAEAARAKHNDIPPEERRVRELLGSGRRHIDNGEYAQAIRDLKEASLMAPENAAIRAELKRAQLAKRTEEKVLGGKN